MRRSRTWVAVGIAASILAVLPATALAAGIDQRSDHAALTAYRSYLRGLAESMPAVRSAESAFVSSTSDGCAGALNPLNGLSTHSINQTAVFDFGEELGGSAFVVAYSPGRGPFATLSATLERLHWSSPQTAKIVSRYVIAQNRLFALAPSDVCTDAQALVASGAHTVPPSTGQWVAEFQHDTAAEESAAGPFAKVLEQFETPADKAIVASEDRLLQSLSGKLKSIATSGATKILNALAT